MKLTKLQKKAVKGEIKARMSAVFGEMRDVEAVTNEITDEVIEDIEETADWTGLDKDEVVLDDISIAIARVLKIRIFGEDI